MKARINTELIIGRLSKMARVIPKKIITPITETVLLQIKGTTMDITVNNWGIQAVTSIMIDADTDFSVCIEFNLLLNTLRGLRVSEFFIESDGNATNVVANRKKYVQIGHDPATFFPMYEARNEGEIIVDSFTFKEAIGVSGNFVNLKNPHEIMQGVCLMANESTATVYATDGFSIAKLSFGVDATNFGRITLPATLCAIIGDMIYQTERLTIVRDDKTITIKGKDFRISAIQLQGNYPDCEPLFMGMPSETAIVSQDEMKGAMNTLKMYASETQNAVSLTVKSGEMTLYCRNEKSYEGTETLIVHNGVNTETHHFNINFLANVVSAIQTGEVALHINDSPKQRSFLLPRFTSDPIIDSQFIIMPMML